jgi:hypothetical protein
MSSWGPRNAVARLGGDRNAKAELAPRRSTDKARRMTVWAGLPARSWFAGRWSLRDSPLRAINMLSVRV